MYVPNFLFISNLGLARRNELFCGLRRRRRGSPARMWDLNAPHCAHRSRDWANPSVTGSFELQPFPSPQPGDGKQELGAYF